VRRKRLLWQLYPSYLLITLLCLIAVSLYVSRSLRLFYIDKTKRDLKARASLLEKQVLEKINSEDRKYLDSLVKKLGEEALTRITVILPSGEVIADSQEDPKILENHADRPEIISALAGRVGSSSRFSTTLNKNMLYVAIPILSGDDIVGVIRTSVPLTSITEMLGSIYINIALGVLIAALTAAVVSFLVSRRIARPLEELKKGAELFARGELRYKLPLADSQEIAGLAEAMNQMSVQLADRISAVVRQRNELETVLSSMVEGVLAVDNDERLIGINKAAAKLIGVNKDKVQGRILQEVLRNIDLQQSIRTILSTQQPVEREIVIHNNGDRFLQAHGTILSDAEGKMRGALIVLNDVTRLRRLENIRRDFVANVSHELKTPITSIKGFVETLVDGAINNSYERKKFITIIANQADRLNAIIDDLLTLSRIEQEEEKAELMLTSGKIKEVLESAIHACQVKASEKEIKIELRGDDYISANINPQLLEQAVVNLIDNAIKYSEKKSTVEVELVDADTENIINVRDYGCGIEKKHLPRLFERFYRIDKARSRKLGGTGLGLAIVKHIARVHRGYATVESTPGKGSTFSIHLPKI
jgi:two-component system phosphate regulon sensor histidine kinase PhoR